MRKGILLISAAALLFGAGWWWHSSDHAGEQATRATPETDEQARARFAKTLAQLNAILSAPLPAPAGDLEISGQVVGPNGPLPGAIVTATRPEPGETLSELPCPGDG